MSSGSEKDRIKTLRTVLAGTVPGAYLAESRVVRRVIREQYGFVQLSAAIPHIESQIVSAECLSTHVHPDELGLDDFSEIPARCILLSQPTDSELNDWSEEQLLLLLWRRLFHASIDRELSETSSPALQRSFAQQKIAELGQVEFDEAHFVLRSEYRLIDPVSRTEALREFCATYLEFLCFEPDLIETWFPSVPQALNIRHLLPDSFDFAGLLQQTRPPGAQEPDLTSHVARDEAGLSRTRKDWSLNLKIPSSGRSFARAIRRSERATERGNTSAAIVHAMAARQLAASTEQQQQANNAVQTQISFLVRRLQRAINFSQEESPAWQESFRELANNAIHGFWNAEKRLLYDIQKVCLDHERVTYKVDLLTWIMSRGKRPLRRPLGSLREVMMTRHLASAAARLVSVRLSGNERDRLNRLLHNAARLAEMQMRNRMRPILKQTFEDVGLAPASIPEEVASDKMIEDALDCITDRGYLSMGYLRDSISRNDLKLPDLDEIRDIWKGDHLLRADDRLHLALDGVYRKGEFYLRWLQTTSSIFFGNRTGQFATLFLLIPFGGAIVIVEGVRHMSHVFHGSAPAPASATTAGELQLSSSEPQISAAADDDAAADSVQTNAEPPPAQQIQPEQQTGSAGGVSDDRGAAAGNSTQPDDSRTDPAAEADPADSATAPAAAANDTQIAIVTGENSETEQTEVPVDGPTDPTATAAQQQSTATDQAVDNTTAAVQQPVNAGDAFGQIWQSRLESASWTISIGFLLMALIHLPWLRRYGLRLLSSVLRQIRFLCVTVPITIFHLPLVQQVWKNQHFIRFRRIIFVPGAAAWLLLRAVPGLLGLAGAGLQQTIVTATALSMVLNSRAGRDVQELTWEWLGNVLQRLHARIFVALLDFIVDIFRLVLNLIERLLYAVDEWLRFHSEESWLSLVVKALLGVVWSFVSFLVRIYVNLLIEPTFHPVKHFPVVTVAHKMILPGLIVIRGTMVGFLGPYLGPALAESVTWFNIFFIPGIFGFIVWELKENWRLYASNRAPVLTATPVGSHGETVARLLRPGFHSGTLPKLFRRLRRLEKRPPSFRRFSRRRGLRDQLEHVEDAIRNFTRRELIRLLQLCPVWGGTGIRCSSVRAASNSFFVDLDCPLLGDEPLSLLFQEQSSWVVAGIASPGWLTSASPEQRNAFEHALEGFYRRSGVDMVREQLEASLVHTHPYDIDSEGITIWPAGDFSSEVTVDLTRKYRLRPMPAERARQAGIDTANKQQVLFAETYVEWHAWVQCWELPQNADGQSDNPLPAACRSTTRTPVLDR